MFSFGTRSRAILDTCHTDLIRLGEEAIKDSKVDFACTDGYRTAETQARKVAEGLTKVAFSKHQHSPSLAVHFEPWPILYPEAGLAAMENTKRYARYYMLAGYIMIVAERLGIPIRWGGDWDGDHDIMDQTFDDLAHFELADRV